MVHKYRQYQSLRSICKIFQEVFQLHPELSAYLFLGEHQPPTAVVSLLRHLQRNKSITRRLIAQCSKSSSLEAVLSGAVTAANRPLQMLTSAIIQNCPTLSLTLLSTCTSLQSCTFTHGQTMLDVSALRALPRLIVLRLHGDVADQSGFLGVEQLLHLEELEVESTEVQGKQEQWMFSSSLQTLRIERSALCNMHEDGVSQCTALESLCLDDCLIESQAMENLLDIRECSGGPAELPNNLSALTLTDRAAADRIKQDT